tara:strand:+ start:210 stop:425 length:216 start_codon:yes stop_codon:yes gene_type:complete
MKELNKYINALVASRNAHDAVIDSLYSGIDIRIDAYNYACEAACVVRDARDALNKKFDKINKEDKQDERIK